MNVQSVSCVYFSPTGTTKTIVENISQGINAGQTEMIDITKSSLTNNHSMSFKNELVILATPVYYGRVPEVAALYFSKLKAEQTPVVLVVVYGNRAYEDALIELHDIAVECKFSPVAGGVFVGEHSYSSSKFPIAHERPDESDCQKAREFGVAVREKLQGLKSIENLTSITVPGQTPYIEPENLYMVKKVREFVALTPETDTSICTQCGLCAEACPTDAISSDDVTETDRWKCIICYACIKKCPEEARHLDEPNMQAAIENLYNICKERKEPELYL